MLQDDITNLWYEKATVRHTPRILLGGESGDDHPSYPAARCFICDHPIVQARGHAVRSYIITQASYFFLYNVVLMETRFVIQSSLAILHGDNEGIDDFQKLRALTVLIDEGYHAHVALDYILQMRRKSGIEPLIFPKSNRKIDAIGRATAGLPEELRSDFQLLAVTLAENVITEEIASMGREKDAIKSFATLMMDHVKDEGRHSNYFSDLMKSRWAVLPRFRQEALGQMLPGFMRDYLCIDAGREFESQILRACDISPGEITQVLRDSDEAFTASHELMTRKTRVRLLHLIRQIGVLDLPVCRQAFAENGYST